MVIFAIVICYNPDKDRLLTNIKSIAKQVDNVVIIDNGSANFVTYESVINKIERVNIIKMPKNEGIAYALNKGLDFCYKKCDWVITLDQDSVSDENMVASLVKYSFLEKAAIISPKIIDVNYQNSVKKVDSEYCKEVETAITSGCLNNVNVLLESGGFDSKMFIDYVDHEICLRLRKKGFKIYRVDDAVLYQEVGKISVHSFCGIKIATTNHTPFRRYFLFRNKIYIYKKYCMSFPLWCIVNMLSSIKVFFRILLLEKNKGKNLYCMLKGLKDGFLNNFDNEYIFKKI